MDEMEKRIAELKSKIDVDGDQQFGPSTIDIDELVSLLESENTRLRRALIEAQDDAVRFCMLAFPAGEITEDDKAWANSIIMEKNNGK